MSGLGALGFWGKWSRAFITVAVGLVAAVFISCFLQGSAIWGGSGLGCEKGGVGVNVPDRISVGFQAGSESLSLRSS